MGTSIYCFFAHQAEWEPAALQQHLDALCAPLASDLDALRQYRRFSDDSGTWSIWPWDTTTGCLAGDGPAGLGIYLYQRVVCLTSAARFSALYRDDGVAMPLRRLLCSLAVSFASARLIAVAAAGFGNTDRASDVAYYNNGSFDDVCRELHRAAGDPTDDWALLGDNCWYLGAPVVSRGNPAAA
jgi:hypothetical protein